jgi:hypothetical protein
MRRFWFEFTGEEELPIGLQNGCGVSADSYEEALGIIKQRVFGGGRLPPIYQAISNVNLDQLDSNHVLPNMGNVLIRGIWFPMGYQS